MCSAPTLAASGALAQRKVSLVLNWVPTADHSPHFYAKEHQDAAGMATARFRTGI
jgi:ABC-type nitrate/sulfonate/bicarbonate transport system substrate-binding protein